MKRCYYCKQYKPKLNFGFGRRNKDGLASLCKECASKRAKLYRAENKVYLG